MGEWGASLRLLELMQKKADPVPEALSRAAAEICIDAGQVGLGLPDPAE